MHLFSLGTDWLRSSPNERTWKLPWIPGSSDTA